MEQKGRLWNGSAQILEYPWNRDSSNTDEEMPVQRHEVPTHLNIEDNAFAGLTMRQLMVAIIGLALAYSAMSEAPLPLVVRLAARATVLLMTAAIALWQPADRSLEAVPPMVICRSAVTRRAIAPSITGRLKTLGSRLDPAALAPGDSRGRHSARPTVIQDRPHRESEPR